MNDLIDYGTTRTPKAHILYLGAAHGSELEAVAAVGEQRGAVAVLGGHGEGRQHGGPQVQQLRLRRVGLVLVVC